MQGESDTRKMYDSMFQVDDRLWTELGRLGPEDVLRRTGVEYEKSTGVYVVPFLGERYRVDPVRRCVARGKEVLPPNEEFQLQLVLITYLVRASDAVPQGRMITEKELPGGTLFFQGPHRLAVDPLLDRYGYDAAAFKALGKQWKGSEGEYGDVSFTLWVLPKIPVGFILYEGDEEFPPRMVVTFDASIDKHFPLDVVWALVNVVVDRMTASAVS